MCLQIVISKKTWKKKIIFVGIMKAIDDKSRIQIRKSVVRTCGSGSLPKCHGSTTLVRILGTGQGKLIKAASKL